MEFQLKFNYGTLSHKMKWFNWVSRFIYKNLLFFPERKIFLSPFLGNLLKIFLIQLDIIKVADFTVLAHLRGKQAFYRYFTIGRFEL